MRRVAYATALAVALPLTAGGAAADTHAPSAQTIPIDCGGTTLTVVSPTMPSKVGQLVGSTGTAVLRRETFTDAATGEVTVIADVPGRGPQGALTECTADVPGGTITLTLLFTPAR